MVAQLERLACSGIWQTQMLGMNEAEQQAEMRRRLAEFRQRRVKEEEQKKAKSDKVLAKKVVKGRGTATRRAAPERGFNKENVTPMSSSPAGAAQGVSESSPGVKSATHAASLHSLGTDVGLLTSVLSPTRLRLAVSPVRAKLASDAERLSVAERISIWEEQMQSPRPPPPSPLTPSSVRPGNSHSPLASLLTQKLQAAACRSSPSQDQQCQSPGEQPLRPSRQKVNSPVPCRVLLDSLDEYAEPANSSKLELSVSPTKCDHSSATAKEARALMTRSLFSAGDPGSPAADDKVTQSSQQPEPEPEGSADCKTFQHDMAQLRCDIISHTIRWGEQTALDMEDFLSRASDFETFLWINRRDIISQKFVQDVPPEGGSELETVPEYPPEWPAWRINSYELREAVRACRALARARARWRVASD
mmetsp:Transcript_60389/g.143952  ORF Transcript_60389/g.143952 Transcript_60389/m.143952 type:complete len:419 (-) Transcript_60389:175-1431(-)